ncbi:hypothetical protein BJI67_05090 [Acidihalobacter aeolianus]|uniref:HTH gntR-type domain-containing protein n=1 Tax=Acidihalobacter aeolianus TaxID=2792603 RepID=A0A1D8K6J6_9GAMM|nr:GntR family transcriptional regulator [Acidihalobacter aeolianus]AOV16530.1 hypothetical protein BJI67_05090 [Acidihalobacter aeolianus]
MSGYQEAADYIAAQISDGQLKPGEQLVSERQLSETVKVSRQTLRAALLKLEADGLIYGVSRRGWFVSPPRFVYDLERRANYKAMAEAQGRRPEIRLLESGRVRLREVPTAARDRLGSSVCRLRRVRFLDGRAVMSETIYLAAEVLPGVLGRNLADSVTALLKDGYGIDIDREETQVRSTLLDATQAAALGVAPATHCLSIERARYSGKVLIEFDVECWLPGAIEIRLTSTA